MNFRKNIALAFALLMGLLLSEAGLHTLLHESHHEEEQHETCDGHHHEADSSQDSICSHEHQCELCVLIQTSTNFLPQVKSQGFVKALPKAHFYQYENVVCFDPLEVSSPRAPPVA
ncbi:hypothetical protein O3Q51_10540 [Cryomorphaceae bacterium 1068]|nr:hypothetical protein [Cryomorphaceae bacterium 1068]